VHVWWLAHVYSMGVHALRHTRAACVGFDMRTSVRFNTRTRLYFFMRPSAAAGESGRPSRGSPGTGGKGCARTGGEGPAPPPRLVWEAGSGSEPIGWAAADVKKSEGTCVGPHHMAQPMKWHTNTWHDHTWHDNVWPEMA
jgi:hypothetical protein